MSDKKIEEGDIVDVFFEHCEAILNVEVLYTPCATGDSFHLKDSNGNLYNVQNYAYMIRRNKKENNVGF